VPAHALQTTHIHSFNQLDNAVTIPKIREAESHFKSPLSWPALMEAAFYDKHHPVAIQGSRPQWKHP